MLLMLPWTRVSLRCFGVVRFCFDGYRLSFAVRGQSECHYTLTILKLHNSGSTELVQHKSIRKNVCHHNCYIPLLCNQYVCSLFSFCMVRCYLLWELIFSGSKSIRYCDYSLLASGLRTFGDLWGNYLQFLFKYSPIVSVHCNISASNHVTNYQQVLQTSSHINHRKINKMNQKIR